VVAERGEVTASLEYRVPGIGARLLGPVLSGVAMAAATSAVALRDPHVPGSWGTCPWLAITGTYCPGCGGLRAVNDLVHLHPLEALSSNAFAVAFVLGAGVAWIAWLAGAVRGRRVDWSRWVKPRVVYPVLVLLIVFSVVRNLPFGAFLAP
jgi:hypothetical protein